MPIPFENPGGHRPTVTVLIPAYNAEQFLAETIQSVLDQTRPADEILIVDDGSTDGTPALLRSYGDRIRSIRQENQGIAGARNTGIREARSEYIALFDADDVMMPTKLEKQMTLIEQDSDLAVVYSGFAYWYKDGKTVDSPAFPSRKLQEALRYRTPVLPSTSIVRRSAILEVGGFRKMAGVDDWDLWLRLMRKYSSRAFREVEDVLTKYRRHDDNMTSYGFMAMGGTVLKMTEADLLNDLPPWRRQLWQRRIESRVFYHTALKLREIHDEKYWPFALESFLRWPFPSHTLTLHRYRVLAHMLVTRFRARKWTKDYWWPKRNCRHELQSAT